LLAVEEQFSKRKLTLISQPELPGFIVSSSFIGLVQNTLAQIRPPLLSANVSATVGSGLRPFDETVAGWPSMMVSY
jgi:hypothetical protein